MAEAPFPCSSPVKALAPVPPLLIARVEVEVMAPTPLPSRISPEERVAAPVPPRYTFKVEEALHTPLSMTGTPERALESMPVPPYSAAIEVPFQVPLLTVPRYDEPEMESAVEEAYGSWEAVVEVATKYATVGEVEADSAPVPPEENIHPCPKVVAPVPPWETESVPEMFPSEMQVPAIAKHPAARLRPLP